MRDRYAEYKDSGLEWIGEIPAHWKTMRFKFIAQLINDKSIHDGKKYIGMENIESWTGKYLDMGEIVPESLCNNFCKGDILFGKLRPYLAKAYIAEENGTCSSEILVFRTSSILRRYLFYLLLSFGFIEHINSSTYGAKMPRANWDFIGKSYIPIPPQDEQNVIVEFLDNKLHKLDHLINERTDQFSMLTRFKRELIAKCVTKGLDKSAPMKPSGEDWIGDVPEHWRIQPLFSVAKENKEKNISLSCDNLLSLSYGNIIRKDINSNYGLLPASFESYQVVQKGYTVLRLTDLQNDQCSLRTGYVEEKGIITSAYLALIPSTEMDSKYFHYLLHAFDLIKVFYGLGSGLRQTLNFNDFKHLRVLMPPVDEQERIAAYLDEKIRQIDAAVVDITSQIQKLKDYRRILIHDAVTGKIKI